jgi:Holliday junction resolvase RusA-like endonuclease
MSAPLVDAWIACRPRPQGRPRAGRSWTGRHVTYTDDDTRAAAEEQAALLAPHAPREPFAGPLRLELAYYLPASREDGWHVSRPDADNLAKLTMDAMSRLRFWADDSQVCWLSVQKHRETDPAQRGVKVVLLALEAAR